MCGMARVCLLLVIMLLMGVTASAQPPDTVWTRIYGGEDNETAMCGGVLSGDTFIVAGRTSSWGYYPNEIMVVKLDMNGDTVWTNIFGAPYFDYVEAIVEAYDGTVAIGGRHSAALGAIRTAWLFKLNPDGSLDWEKDYTGADDLETYAMVATFDSGFTLAGYTSVSGASYDFWLLHADSVGDSVWYNSFGGPGDDRVTDMIQTADSGYLVVGSTKSYGAGGTNIWIVKTDKNGDTLWTRVFGNDSNEASPSIDETSDGNYIIGSSSSNAATGNYDPYLIKIQPDGDTLWTKFVPCDRSFSVTAVTETSDKGFLITGNGTYGYPIGTDVYVAKINAAIDTVWTTHVGGKGTDRGLYVHEAANGEAVILGQWYAATSAADLYAIKLASQSCCTGPSLGNVDCTGIVDMGDVTVMINKLFISLDEFCCEEEADIDGNEILDIGDLSLLITYLFITLDTPPPCP